MKSHCHVENGSWAMAGAGILRQVLTLDVRLVPACWETARLAGREVYRLSKLVGRTRLTGFNLLGREVAF